MALVLNEEQRLLQDTARDFLSSNAPVEALRTLRDESDATGYSAPLWQKMAEMGWASVILPEAWVGPNSRLERVIVGPGVEIPANSSYKNALICGKTGADTDEGLVFRRDGDLLISEFAYERLPTA